MEFVAKHLNDPFFMEKTERVDLRAKIFRELVSNLILACVHNCDTRA
jgi:ATP-dependent DNA helicase RecG